LSRLPSPTGFSSDSVVVEEAEGSIATAQLQAKQEQRAGGGWRQQQQQQQSSLSHTHTHTHTHSVSPSLFAPTSYKQVQCTSLYWQLKVYPLPKMTVVAVAKSLPLPKTTFVAVVATKKLSTHWRCTKHTKFVRRSTH